MIVSAPAAARSPRLVLASTSPYRKTLLAQLKLPFETCSPDCDEDAFKRSGLPPQALAEKLAVEKALAVARSQSQSQPDAFVLGCDQLVDLDGEVLGKPGTEACARAQLEKMNGRCHRLITAIALACPDGRVLLHTDLTELTMRRLSGAEIARYVAHDKPLDCAGSYKIEQLGITLFESVACADFSAIGGLPLIALTSLLRAEGFTLP